MGGPTPPMPAKAKWEPRIVPCMCCNEVYPPPWCSQRRPCKELGLSPLAGGVWSGATPVISVETTWGSRTPTAIQHCLPSPLVAMSGGPNGKLGLSLSLRSNDTPPTVMSVGATWEDRTPTLPKIHEKLVPISWVPLASNDFFPCHIVSEKSGRFK